MYTVYNSPLSRLHMKEASVRVNDNNAWDQKYLQQTPPIVASLVSLFHLVSQTDRFHDFIDLK